MPDVPRSPALDLWRMAPRPTGAEDLALESLCSDLAAWLGFADVAVALVREDLEELEYVAVHGGSRAQARRGRFVPMDRLLAQLAEAELHGVARYLAAEERVRHGFRTASTPRGGEGEWHPDDLVLAVVQEEARLRGLVVLDRPLDGRVPDVERMRMLHEWTVDTAPLILAADGRRRLDQQVRLSQMANEVLRLSADSWRSAADFLEASVEVVRQVTDAAVAWTHLVADDTWRRVTDPDVEVPEGVNRELGRLLLPAVERLLVLQEAVVLSGERLTGPVEVVQRLGPLVDPWLAAHGQPQLLLVPLGSGQDLLGFAALARRPEAPQWSDLEVAAVRQVVADLGAFVRNVQYEQQRAVLQDLKRSFVATLVHELKNPVTSVKAHAELLEPLVEGSPAGRRSVAALKRAGEQFERTVRDLLLFAQYDDGSVALDLEELDLAAVVRECVGAFVDEAGERQVSLVADLPEEPLKVLADATAMERLANNLVGNAVKYTDSGGVVALTLRLDHEGVGGTDGGVVLEVADTGIGIAEEHLDHLFREFYRSPDPAARDRPGTGLGLAVVQRIVQRHDGEIAVTSELGRGTTFTVWLPPLRVTGPS